MLTSISRSLKILAAGLLALAMVWQHIEATRLGYEVEISRKQASRLKSRIAAVQMDLQRSVSPAHLALQARSRLGMFPLRPEALRLIGVPPGAGDKGPFLARFFSRLIQSLSA